MGNVQKGNRAELEYKKKCEAQGYKVYKPPRTKYGDNDLFNLFDMLAINKEEVLLIQVKCNQARDARRKIRSFTEHPACVKKILAIKIDRKGWKEEVIE